MEISLNVLNHLGIRLYSNTPAVLSEAIANSWDAGAENVQIQISQDEMIIEDDGIGMSLEDLNNKFLLVGYQKRENGETLSPKHNRKVMGRKGIGKLSLFSIANIIEVQSVKNGVKNGFIMNLHDIQKVISDKNNSYRPTELVESNISLSSDGTRIILKEIKKNVNRTEDFLKKRIARRFAFLQVDNKFTVKVNDHIVSVSDRMYFDKLQAIWYIGEESKHFIDYCDKDKLKHNELISPDIESTNYSINGWIGTVDNSGTLKEGSESLNKVSILVRGKIALEDILSEYPETGLFAKYLIGEIHADFLDEDDIDDIATSNRQDFLKDDDRYKLLKNWIGKEIKKIQKQWDALREKNGVIAATEVPAIKEWFNSLKGDSKDSAKKIFGKINQIVNDNPDQKKILFQQSVIAFEFFRHKEELSKLTNLTDENVQSVLDIFASLDNLEASLYHKIVKQRLEVIKQLESKVNENSLEKTIQAFLFDHLWLLDPSWERATGSEMMEKSFQDALEEAKLTDEERLARMDIKYRATSGTHVVIELKKPDVSVSAYDLIKQVNKYKRALKKVMGAEGSTDAVKAVCIVGKVPTEFKDPEEKEGALTALSGNGVQIFLYNDLLASAKKSYQSYLSSQVDIGRIQEILDKIDSSSFI